MGEAQGIRSECATQKMLIESDALTPFPPHFCNFLSQNRTSREVWKVGWDGMMLQAIRYIVAGQNFPSHIYHGKNHMAGPLIATRESPLRYLGCCGAHCKTCGAWREGVCKGCKLGYDQRKRDIARAKCAMKVCCFKERELETCADCPEYSTCDLIKRFFSKKGFKYGKYRQSIEFIRKNGYSEFLTLANQWNGPYGTLDE